MTRTWQKWGQHLILDFSGCPGDHLRDESNIRDWLKELVSAIDMRAYGEPLIEHFASHSFEAAGFTAIQLIETSNISAHFAENLGEAYIDVFSCKQFDRSVAIDISRRFFKPQWYRAQDVDRGSWRRDIAPRDVA